MSRTRIILYGFIVGSSMSIPGISGGTMAMILGVYSRLLTSVDEIFKKPKQALPFLLMFAAGGALGFFTAAKLLTMLFATPAEVPLKFAFLGAAAGCIPTMLRSSSALPLAPKKLLLICAGAAIAAVLSYLPTAGEVQSDLISQLLVGMLLAVALVLPGISVSQTLLIFGMYEFVISSVADGNFISLLPLAAGGVIGVFVSAKLLTRLLERFNGAYLVIVGFMIFSLTQLVPEISGIFELFLGVICCTAGAIFSYLVCKSEKNHDVVCKTT